MIILYGINNCDTIKKTKNWFDAAGLDYQFHDYKKHGCSEELAEELIKRFELDKLINKRGTTWRNLSEQQKNELNETTAIALMTSQPSVIKRPIVRAGRQWLLGFDEQRWQKLLR